MAIICLMARRILVVDDDPQLAEAVRNYLSHQGFTVAVAADGSDARLMAIECDPELVLLDAELPGIDGHTLARLLRRDPRTKAVPVILMSGRLVEDEDVVKGLEGGADDYLLKPFTMKVLLARIRAVLRRYEPASGAKAKLKALGLELDPAAREAKVGGKGVQLTRKEFDLLALLVEKAGRVLSAPFLLEAVWGYDPADYNDPHTMETHVSQLRKKVGA